MSDPPTDRIVKTRVCAECGCEIEPRTGLCKVGCKYDGSLARPRSSVKERLWKQTLIREV